MIINLFVRAPCKRTAELIPSPTRAAPTGCQLLVAVLSALTCALVLDGPYCAIMRLDSSLLVALEQLFRSSMRLHHRANNVVLRQPRPWQPTLES